MESSVLIFEINIPQPSICFLILLKRLEIAICLWQIVTVAKCDLGRQSLNPKSLMNGLKRDLRIFVPGHESVFHLYSKKRKTRKVTMMENRGLIDEYPGRHGWE